MPVHADAQASAFFCSDGVLVSPIWSW